MRWAPPPQGEHDLEQNSRMACRSEFATDKARVLGQVDLSRKGSVDEPIAPLVEYLNSVENYYTTSSCSGRISAFSQVR